MLLDMSNKIPHCLVRVSMRPGSLGSERQIVGSMSYEAQARY